MITEPQHNVFAPGEQPADPLPTFAPQESSRGELLFSLGDKNYYMPNEVPPNIAFRFLRDRRREDAPFAIAGVIEALLGVEALDALADADDMSKEDMKTLMKIIREKVVGKMEEAMDLGK